MTTKRVTMLKLNEILRLKYEANLSHRQIARSLGISLGVVSKYLERAHAAGINWPLPESMTDKQLQQLLQPRKTVSPIRLIEPDYNTIHRELKPKGMTLQLLWEEYTQSHPSQHYSYSHFCRSYREWAGKQKLSMRQIHHAGEKLFIDYCGPTVPIVNGDTGEIRDAQIFVAVMGASNYTYAEAMWTQGL